MTFNVNQRTLIEQACTKVPEFQSFFDKMHTQIKLNGQSASTLQNYGKCLAKMSLHFGCIPLHLSDAQINDYLLMLNDTQAPSLSYSDCRTAALGGHIDACTACGTVQVSYNSCRNRNCNKCQNLNREKWIMAREEELLNTSYFHVVFTIPEQLNLYCLHYPKVLYNILLKAAWQTLHVFAKDPKHLGAQTGATAVLHTWGQNLSLHPHVHLIVPGGGLTPSGKWKMGRGKGKFLFPVKAMSLVFRAKFVALLRKASKQENIPIPNILFKQLFQKKWVVYAK